MFQFVWVILFVIKLSSIINHAPKVLYNNKCALTKQQNQQAIIVTFHYV